MTKKAKAAPGAARKRVREAPAEARSEAEAAARAETEPQAEPLAEAESLAEAEVETEPQAEVETEPQAEAEAVTETLTEVGPQAEAPIEAEEALAAARAEIAELKDRLLRAMAETENVRRRGEREREETGKYAITGFARGLLGVADNLRRAIASVPAEARQDDEALTNLLDGVELTERELLTAFERHGIRPIDPLGEKFDHNWHQAMTELEDPSSEPGTIIQVMQVGYAIADRLLRPAMVVLAKGAKPEDKKGRKVDTTV